jgi:ubiquinone/menaquinone biosynthesis C-methylase UbiE
MTTQPNPERVWALISGYQKTAALRAAVDLHVFTAIGEGASTAEAIAAKCNASQRGIRILCDYLTIETLLDKQEGNYRLTPTSAVFLDEKSPQYMGGMLNFLNSARVMEAAADLTQIVRRGSTTLGEGGLAVNDAAEWVAFAKHMTPMAAPQAQFIAEFVANQGKPSRVLDIAAGHGLYGIAFAKRLPEASVVAQDWPNVLAVAEENARAAGVADRYKLLPGSAFEVDFGKGFDVVLLTNFLHHLDEAACIAFLRKVRTALNDGGRLVTLEFVPNEDRISPPVAAAFSLTMLQNTPSGDAYSAAELKRMLDAAGFGSHQVAQVPQSAQSIVLSHAT